MGIINDRAEYLRLKYQREKKMRKIYQKKYYWTHKKEWKLYNTRNRSERKTKNDMNEPREYKGMLLFTTKRLSWQLGYTSHKKKKQMSFPDYCRIGRSLWVWDRVQMYLIGNANIKKIRDMGDTAELLAQKIGNKDLFNLTDNYN